MLVMCWSGIKIITIFASCCGFYMLHIGKYYRILLGSLAVVRIFPEWIMSPEQVNSSGRTATFNLWIGMFWDIYTECLVTD